LTSEGFDVVGYQQRTGKKDLEAYKERYPNVDLVTMDITMPRMDGVTALEKIIEFDKERTRGDDQCLWENRIW
jgi:two-component system, chemotaxis family, chemotaxis protein CheY